MFGLTRLHIPLAPKSVKPPLVGLLEMYMRCACIDEGSNVYGYVVVPIACTMNIVESVFQRFSSALPLEADTNERFTAGVPGSVFQSVIRAMRLPKSGSVTTVFAPRRFPTFGICDGICTTAESVREQL
jgi:hypothetical protein